MKLNQRQSETDRLERYLDVNLLTLDHLIKCGELSCGLRSQQPTHSI